MTTLINRDLLRGRAYHYARLMRLDRPIGTLLLLWPTLWALWLAAEGWPDPRILTVFVLGVILMRSAGCVINDYADRGFDPYVERTRERPIAAGHVKPGEALALFIVLCSLAFGLVLLMNWLTILLAFVAAVLAATYPFTKRYTHLPQIHLGAAFGCAVPMAFAAQTGTLAPVAGLLFLATVIWATAYDTMYAMVDRDDDVAVGVKSTAILFGEYDRPMIGILQALFFLTLVVVGVQAGLGIAYYAGLGMAGGFALYQQYLIRHREPGHCLAAFLNNGWLGAAVFLGVALDYPLRAGGL